MEQKISGDLRKDEQYLITTIGQGLDTQYRHLLIPALDNCSALIVYIKGLINITELEDAIIRPLTVPNRIGAEKRVKKITLPDFIKSSLFIAGIKPSQNWTEICDAIVSGNSVLFIDKCPSAFILANTGWESRTISEPTSEVEIRGPKDSFVEDLVPNMALIRRRIRDYGLRFEAMRLGDRTKTDIALVYIEGLTNDEILTELRTRLGKIKIDAIIASNTIEELIEDSKYSIFPKMLRTERPDKATAALLEGRIVLIADNTPFVVIAPTIFWHFLQSPTDYYEKYILGTFWRLIRLLAMFLAVSSSSAYVLLTSFHQEMLPTSLALKIAADRQGVPFPAAIEAFIMEILLEVMNEAGLRLPKALGQTVSIVGTLVIGQAAVQAGLIGPALVIAVATGAIASYAIPSFAMSNTIRLLRFPVLLSSALFGIFGYLGAIIFMTLYLISLRSLGTPYYSPISPYQKDPQKDTLLRAPYTEMKKRPETARPQDSVRQPGSSGNNN